MLFNYIVSALRSLARNWLYSTISIFGLAASFAGAILIFQFVRNEFSYDRWIPGHEDVYKVIANLADKPTDPYSPTDITQPTIRQQLKAAAPDIIVETARLLLSANTVHPANDKAGEGVLEQGFAWADPEIFTVLPLPALTGDLNVALTQPDTVVLTRAMARRYFNEDAPIGKMLDVQLGAERRPMKVTAVLKDLPSNTTIVSEIIASAKSTASPLTRMDAGPPVRTGISTYTYARAKPGTPIDAMKRAVVAAGQPETEAFAKANMGFAFSVLPIADSHLTRPGLTAGYIKPTGSDTTAWAISAVGALIVLVASINFVTLMTARASRRAIEVGMRKAIGARRSDLIVQFIGEGLILALLSVAMAVGLAYALLEPFNAFIRREVTIDLLNDWQLAGALAGLTALIGVLGGLYPALVLSSFKPAQVLKGGKVGGGASPVMRSMMIVVQFAILIGLIISSATIYQQTQYALKQGLGESSDLILQINAQCNNAFPDEVRKLPGVSSVACSSTNALSSPSSSNVTQVKTVDGKELVFSIAPMDFGFFETYGVKPVAGRLFDANRAGDGPALPRPPPPVPGQPPPPPPTDPALYPPRAVMLNVAVTKAMEFATPQDAVGKTMMWRQPGPMPDMRPSEIIGVIPDLATTVAARAEPMFYYVIPKQLNMVSVKTTGQNVAQTIEEIRRVWKSTGGTRPIIVSFYSDKRQLQYLDIIIQGVMIAISAAAAVTISALGLFALAAISTERRTREIGVRKALGATTGNVVGLLIWQFTIPVLWAIVIAVPIGYLLMNQWLTQFIYRIELSPLVFAVAAGIALLIAWLTVSVQTFLVARAKPVRALRYE